MANLESEILNSLEASTFFRFLEDVSYDAQNKVATALISLQFRKKIDVLRVFKDFRQDPVLSNSKIIYIFEAIVPRLEVPTLHLMECILHMIQELDRPDILMCFTHFCTNNPSRIAEALTLLEGDPTSFHSFLLCVILAGTSVDKYQYFHVNIKLSIHPDINVRRNAMRAFGEIAYGESDDLVSLAISHLGKNINIEYDDILLSYILSSLTKLRSYQGVDVNEISELVDCILNKGRENCLIVASILFQGSQGKILDVILKYLINASLKVETIRRNIDYGLSQLIEGSDIEKGIIFMERLFVVDDNASFFSDMPCLKSCIVSDPNKLFNRLLTRWFLWGDQNLCSIIEKLASDIDDAAVDKLELKIDAPIQLRFIARKAIGYIFLKPVLATKILLSCLTHSNSNPVSSEISDLLFEFLLMNYPKSVHTYLLENNVGNQDMHVDMAIQRYMVYRNHIVTAVDAQELQPSVLEREQFYRYTSRQWMNSWKEVERKSVWSSLFPTAVLLYGGKSIGYMKLEDENTQRIENNLQSHEIGMEIPRLMCIDPVGLEAKLSILRQEKLAS
jgi:hypothetical protein